MRGSSPVPRWFVTLVCLLLAVLSIALRLQANAMDKDAADARVLQGCDKPDLIGFGRSGIGMTYAYDCAGGQTIVTFEPLGFE